MPTRNYVYGARPPHAERQRVEDQMYPAHRYRNDLVRLELDKRQAIHDTLRRFAPDLLALDAACDQADKAVKDALAAVATENIAQGRKTATAADHKAIAAARKAEKEIQANRKAREAEIRALPAAVDAVDLVYKEYAAKGRALRKACQIWWGTYLVIEDAVAKSCQQLNPQLTRFNGNGEAATQLQLGLRIEDALACTDTRLQIGPLIHRVGRRRAPARIVRMRVGSNKDRSPIWCEVKVSWHRPLPPAARIQWVRLFRTKVGTTYNWQIMFVLKDAPACADQANNGETCGIDVGWRLLPDGNLRMATFAGSDGGEGEVAIPAIIMSAYRHAYSIESIKERSFNRARQELADWLTADPPKADSWLAITVKYLPAWKQAGRLQALISQWRKDRIAGDETIFAALEAWAKQDRHLWSYYRGEQKKVERKVREIQRRWIAMIRRRYQRIVVEKINFRELQRRPGVDEEEQSRRQLARLASVGRLVAWLKETAAECLAVNPAHTTHDCYLCGQRDKWDQAQLMHTCSQCGATWDQDYCAARNLLAGVEKGARPYRVGEDARPRAKVRDADNAAIQAVKPKLVRRNRRRSQTADETANLSSQTDGPEQDLTA